MTRAEARTSPEIHRSNQGEPIPSSHSARFLHLIRFSHTIFALPFALASLIVATHGLPSARVLSLVLVCMVSARTAAMLFNRLADWTIDQRNPRTRSRHLLASRLVVTTALVISSVLFVLASALLNSLTFALAPVALAIVFFYSLTKRFTDATHFILGLALGIAPVAAWIAQTGRIELPPLVLAAGVVCWVGGFDIIYASQDLEFDRWEGLCSLVVRLGLARSLRLAQLLHLLMFAALLVFGVVAKLGPIYFAVSLPIACALVYEHRSAQRLDIVGINRAFFQSNAFVSAVFLLAVCADRLL
jgi:4-hydroxybenzoate polyprenyltransferase